jgi:hypothetical protein
MLPAFATQPYLPFKILWSYYAINTELWVAVMECNTNNNNVTLNTLQYKALLNSVYFLVIHSVAGCYKCFGP